MLRARSFCSLLVDIVYDTTFMSGVCIQLRKDGHGLTQAMVTLKYSFPYIRRSAILKSCASQCCCIQSPESKFHQAIHRAFIGLGA